MHRQRGPGRSVQQHLADILALASPLPAVERPLADAVGRVLVRDLRAERPMPPWDAAAMDGFAVRADDTSGASETAPVTLRVVGDVRAGSASDPEVGPRQAVRIMTGAPLPSTTDAVVPVEHTVGGFAGSDPAVRITHPAGSAGRHVRRRGEDIAPGELLAWAGDQLGPVAAARTAAAGGRSAWTTRTPRVAVISTGDELATAEDAERRGMIPESNSLLLASLATSAGAEVVRAVTTDDVAELHRTLARTDVAACDLVLTSGGVSAGLYEVVRLALTSQSVHFVSVDMRPGHPQAYGRLSDGRLFLGVPGSPGGAALSFELFVRPLLRRLSGASAVEPVRAQLPLAEGWAGRPGRPRYVPVAVDTSAQPWRARPLGSTAGAVLRGYAMIPGDREAVASDELVEVILTP